MVYDYHDLEDELFEAIGKCCTTEEDKKGALSYYSGVTVNGLIEEALEE